MVLGFPFAHIPSHFANDGGPGHDIDAIDLGQVGTDHAKQVSAQAELRFIAVLLESCLALFVRQAGALAPVSSPLEILLQLLIALGQPPAHLCYKSRRILTGKGDVRVLPLSWRYGKRAWHSSRPLFRRPNSRSLVPVRHCLSVKVLDTHPSANEGVDTVFVPLKTR
jgi:hypothetical protein